MFSGLTETERTQLYKPSRRLKSSDAARQAFQKGIQYMTPSVHTAEFTPSHLGGASMNPSPRSR